MKKIIKLDYYRVFYEVAVRGSMRAAAEQLGISQPAVSKTIQKLEYQLGVKLMIRNPNGTRLTADGIFLAEHLDCAIEEITNAVSHICGENNINGKKLYAGVNNSVLEQILKNNEKVSAGRYPIKNIAKAVEQGVFDFGLYYHEHHEDYLLEELLKEDIVNVKIIREYYDIIAVGPAFVELTHQNVSGNILNNYPFLLRDGGAAVNYYLTDIRPIGLASNRDFVVPNAFDRINMAKKNMGVIVEPELYINKEIEKGFLFQVKTDLKLRKSQLYLITSKKENDYVSSIVNELF